MWKGGMRIWEGGGENMGGGMRGKGENMGGGRDRIWEGEGREYVKGKGENRGGGWERIRDR